MSEHSTEIDQSGASWKIEVTIDRSCIDCIVANTADDDGLGGVLINRRDKMISVYNHEIISRDECIANGEHEADDDDLDEMIAEVLEEGVARGLIEPVEVDGTIKYLTKEDDRA